MTVATERELFEAWYIADALESSSIAITPDGMVKLRMGNDYGPSRIALNGKWLGWQAARKSPPACIPGVDALPDSEVDALLDELDKIAILHDPDGYGLPTWYAEALDSMRAQVQWFYGRWVAPPVALQGAEK